MVAEDNNGIKGSPETAPENGPNEPSDKKKAIIKRLFMTAVTIAIVVLVFVYVLPKFASYKDVFEELSKLSIFQLMLVIGAAVLNLACAWTMNQAALPGMNNRQAAQLMLSQNLISSTLPLGGAWSVGLGYEIIHSYGFGVAEYSLMLGVSGVWNTFAKLALPVLAVVLLVFAGNVDGQTVTLAVIGVATLFASLGGFGLILWKRSVAEWMGNMAGKAVSPILKLFHKAPVTNWGEGVADFRDRILSVARHRWPALTLLAVAYQVTTFWVFLLSIRFSGVPAHGKDSVTWIAAFAVFAVARVISAVPITPGAVGIAEASFTGLLVAAGGAEPAVVAGVLLFRGLTWLMPIPLGLPVYGAWWYKREKNKRKAAKSKPDDSNTEDDK